MSEATSGHSRYLQHHFADMEQQNDSGTFGMWVFLVTEIMFFGGIFAAYAIYRSMYLPAFEFGSRLLDVKLGTVNTAVLIGSSLTMVLAVHAAQTGKRKALVFYLLLTMALGGGVSLELSRMSIPRNGKHFLVPGLRFAPDGKRCLRA